MSGKVSAGREWVGAQVGGGVDKDMGTGSGLDSVIGVSPLVFFFSYAARNCEPRARFTFLLDGGREPSWSRYTLSGNNATYKAMIIDHSVTPTLTPQLSGYTKRKPADMTIARGKKLTVCTSGVLVMSAKQSSL